MRGLGTLKMPVYLRMKTLGLDIVATPLGNEHEKKYHKSSLCVSRK